MGYSITRAEIRALLKGESSMRPSAGLLDAMTEHLRNEASRIGVVLCANVAEQGRVVMGAADLEEVLGKAPAQEMVQHETPRDAAIRENRKLTQLLAQANLRLEKQGREKVLRGDGKRVVQKA